MGVELGWGGLGGIFRMVVVGVVWIAGSVVTGLIGKFECVGGGWCVSVWPHDAAGPVTMAADV